MCAFLLALKIKLLTNHQKFSLIPIFVCRLGRKFFRIRLRKKTYGRLPKMSILRNFVYNITYDMKHETIIQDDFEASRIKRYTKRGTVERESNVYASLSIKSYRIVYSGYKRASRRNKIRLSDSVWGLVAAFKMRF